MKIRNISRRENSIITISYLRVCCIVNFDRDSAEKLVAPFETIISLCFQYSERDFCFIAGSGISPGVRIVDSAALKDLDGTSR